MPVIRDTEFQVVDLGRIKYGHALNAQCEAVEYVVTHPHVARILVVEHDPVLTLGKNSDPKYLLFPMDFYQKQGVEIFTTERGGEVTAHMPGQIVIYPILSMNQLKLNVRSYVRVIEDAVMGALARYGIDAHRDEEHPGVWIGHEKICAIGVRIKSRVSMHGLALNVNNDLSLFGKIIPCGIRHRGVTSMIRQTDQHVDVGDVREILVNEIIERLKSK